MLLDVFYTLNRALTMAANPAEAFSSSAMTIPQVRDCTGTYYTNLYTSNSSYIYGLFDDMCNEVRSQTHTGIWPTYPANIVIGTGTTPVQSTDYRLESELKEGISVISTTRIPSYSEGTVKYIRQYQNTSGAELTVNEIGFVSMAYTAGKSSARSFLIFREVLEEPIVVPADGYFTIEFKVQFP